MKDNIVVNISAEDEIPTVGEIVCEEEFAFTLLTCHCTK